MKNKYVSVKCPSCNSNIQMKAKSIRSEIFYCPVCEYGEIENPNTKLTIYCQKVRVPQAVRVPVII